MGATDKGDGKRGVGCTDLGPDILDGGPVSNNLRVRGVGYEPTHRESVGRIPPQGGPQDDRETTSEREEWNVNITPAGGRNGRGRDVGDGDLHLPPPEHSCTVYCDQAHYGPVSSGRADTGDMGLQRVVGSGWGGHRGDEDGGFEGGTVRGGGGDRRDGDENGQLIRWEYTVAKIILGAEPNSPLAYATGLELHHPIMSMLEGNGVR